MAVMLHSEIDRFIAQGIQTIDGAFVFEERALVHQDGEDVLLAFHGSADDMDVLLTKFQLFLPPEETICGIVDAVYDQLKEIYGRIQGHFVSESIGTIVSAATVPVAPKPIVPIDTALSLRVPRSLIDGVRERSLRWQREMYDQIGLSASEVPAGKKADLLEMSRIAATVEMVRDAAEQRPLPGDIHAWDQERLLPVLERLHVKKYIAMQNAPLQAPSSVPHPSGDEVTFLRHAVRHYLRLYLVLEYFRQCLTIASVFNAKQSS